jgi:Protein kinase domain
MPRVDEEGDTRMANNDALGDTVPPSPGGMPSIPEVTLLRELARGGMGIVYRGRQDFLERDVAVKLLAPELQGERFGARFRREAKLLAGIKHPHIVACYAAGVAPTGQHYLVMELVEGPNLEQWITQNGPVPMRSAVRIASQLAAALGHACDLGVIHRDIKTANILLEASNGSSLDPLFPFVPKLGDLGLARMVAGTTDLAQTAPGAVMGTPSTMAPEQFDAPDAVDFRADIYGLGCVLYEMLTGAPAYTDERLTDLVVAKRQPRGPDPSQRGAGVPAPLGELVASMLAHDVADRPADYRTLRTLLEQAAKAPMAPARAAAEPRPAATPAAGPGLLRTAEFEFLATAGATAGTAAQGGAAAAPSTSPFVSRVVEPAAPAAVVAPVAAERRAPTVAPARAMAAPRVIGAKTAPARKLPGGWIAAAAAAVSLVVVAVPHWRRADGPLDTPPAPPVAAAAAPASANQPPRVELIGADAPMRRGDRILLRSRAEDVDGDVLQYEWSVQPDNAASLSSTDEATTTLHHELLPGDEFELWLAVHDGRESTAVEHRVVVDYEPQDLLAGFLDADSGWQNMGRMRSPWRQREDGAVFGIAAELPCLRTRNLEGPVWRVGGTMQPEPFDGRGPGPGAGPVQGAISLRVGPQRHLAIVCAREGERGERQVLSVQQLMREEQRPGAGAGMRPLPEAQGARLEAVDAGEATFTVTRRGDELKLEFGFMGRSERLEHVERLRGDFGAVPLGLMVRGGRVVFGELRLW